jgi:hypothetical protein
VDHLSEFVNSNRAEKHYHVLCEHCGTSIATNESRQQVADAKALAARLIVQLSDPNAPGDAWAQLVKNTVFDNTDAIKVRGGTKSDGTLTDEAVLASMRAFLNTALSGHSVTSDPNTPRYGCFGQPEVDRDGWGETTYQRRVELIKDRLVKGSRTNPHGDVKIPDHDSRCPHKPVEAD